MSIRSTLFVATAIATLGLGSSAFAASYGGLSNDTGSMRPSYYDQNGWHVGLPPAHPAPGANGPAAPGAGAISDEVLQNDWFWGGSRY
jgi:hypothetical protein